VNVARVANKDPLVGNRFRPAEEAPFGLIEEPADAVEAALKHVEDRVDDIAEDILDLL